MQWQKLKREGRKEEEREVNVDEIERWNSTISDRGWKVARSGQGGENMQGMPVSRGGRRLPLADTVPCLGPPQVTSDDRSQLFGEI